MTVPLEKDPQVFVQAGAFSEFANANRVKALLQTIAPTTIRQIDTAEARLFRVRLGPVASIGDADHLLARVVASGIPQARIVVD
ncbi:MAG: SPOR domain-containing protein [Alphaproteobacteria bacterium]|nr:SPOR domain-containing protein [Alphaproteobacteria bacterium]